MAEVIPGDGEGLVFSLHHRSIRASVLANRHGVMMQKLRVLGLLSALVVGLSHQAGATPVKWTLSGVTFNDGALATGAFTYDADSQSLSDYDVTTTAGVLPGHHYLDLAGSFPPYPAAGFAVMDPPSPVDGWIGDQFLALVFSSPLSNTPGILTLVGGSGEGLCVDAGCAIGSYRRSVTEGSLVGTPVPEPATLALLGTGLAAVMRRRLQQRQR